MELMNSVGSLFALMINFMLTKIEYDILSIKVKYFLYVHKGLFY